MGKIVSDTEIKEAVLEKYGQIAREGRLESDPSAGRAATACCGPQQSSPQPAETSSCCGPAPAPAVGCCEPADSSENPFGRFYSDQEVDGLPESVTEMSLGCGNPTAIAALQPGEIVLDLGSGGGIDCFLAARQVGPEGRVIGLDMTPDMIKLARRNAKKIGATNVDFRYGEMEEMPLPDASVDVVISNCVINLSPDKDAVFSEVSRVLRPGGRMSVSDIVLNGELPRPILDSLHAWAGCIAGALDQEDYLAKVEAAGFEAIDVESKDFVRFSETAEAADIQSLLEGTDLGPADLDDKVASIRLRAQKPA
jgi:SAM-dependent methyltransferase